MNTYKITVKGTDILGVKWLHNIVKLANMGAKIEERFHIKSTFPHEVTMLLETENELRLETDMKEGIVVYPVLVAKTREEMEAMEWEDFKKEAKAWGIGGRHRETMTNQYMKATEQEDGVKKVDAPPKTSKKLTPKESTPKKPSKKEEKGVVVEQPPKEEGATSEEEKKQE